MRRAVQLQLNPQLNRKLIREIFARQGRVHIPDLLTAQSAADLHDCLSTQTPWQLSLNIGQRHLDLAHEQLPLIPPDKRELMTRAMVEQARHGFQYVFDNYPLYDIYQSGRRDHPLLHAHEFLNGPPFLDFVREVTQVAGITFADSQATRYSAGHFLTAHDDDVAGKNRRVAYVLNMTPQWRADWGGILQFIDRDGHIAEGYVPKFNALNLFRVPQLHSVSYVAPSAGQSRYSITGWLRGT